MREAMSADDVVRILGSQTVTISVDHATGKVSVSDSAARAEWIAERAAIMEFDGGRSREEAERQAMECWERMFGQRKEGRDE